jgi:hypothetical protein
MRSFAEAAATVSSSQKCRPVVAAGSARRQVLHLSLALRLRPIAAFRIEHAPQEPGDCAGRIIEIRRQAFELHLSKLLQVIADALYRVCVCPMSGCAQVSAGAAGRHRIPHDTALPVAHSRAEAGMKILLALLLALALCACRTNESPEGQANDLQITAHVKSKLASDVGLSTVTNISVNSTNGVVTLAGQVNSTEAKVRAEAAAASVPMVVRVVNNIQVTAKPS